MLTKPRMPLLAAVLLWIGLAGVLPTAEAHSRWEGTWRLSIGKGGYDKSLKCKYSLDSVVKEFQVKLECPDRVTDEFGNVGYWTSVFEIGVEIVIQGRKFYSIPWKRWDMNSTNSTHYINSTENIKWCWGMEVGWSHDVVGNNWACFKGTQVYAEGEHKPEPEKKTPPKPLLFQKRKDRDGKLKSAHELVREINEGQSFWTAETYPEFQNATMDQLESLAGGKYSHLIKPPNPGPITDKQRNESASWYLPRQWDWRNVNGKNYVGAVRNQGWCGSCYAFAATAMQESRVRIMTNNKLTPTYSPQDIVDCSPYAFGCWGGLLFSEAKFGEDYGYAEESCSTYEGWTRSCTSLQRCKRTYSTDYEFIGSHTGGCNELAMQLALYRNGPIVAGFAVFWDFLWYRKGIYYHYGRNWWYGGHAVTVVGWGEDEQTGTKYWIVKNSWGTRWGENGYFRIIRGLNEAYFESVAWQASPIL